MADVQPHVPQGLRLYVIGDLHGRLDLLEQLRKQIAEDAEATKSQIQFIFLGDYIDRGISSRETIDYLMGWQPGKGEKAPIFLRGNHEQVMLNVLDYRDEELLERWMRFGGRETLLSYGIKPSSIIDSRAKLVVEFEENVPASHRAFLEGLKTSVSFGDYFFCHAGVRPGVALDGQEDEDLIWIRQEFLESDQSFGKMVVHGHSISLEAEFCANRIGIDTGAYATGKLTALGLEGTKQWLIQTD